MINRLAVIFIGQYRTWPVCSKYLLNFFKDKAEQVDYFFVTWDTTQKWKTKYSAIKWNKERISVQESDIVDYFNSDSRLVNYSILTDITHQHSYYRMAYLLNHANKLKKHCEESQNFIYDQVVETRPDLYIRPNNKDWAFCSDFEYAGSPIHTHVVDNVETSIMGDLYIRSNSKTNDILSQRIHSCDVLPYGTSPHGQGHHKILTEYVLQNNLRIVNGYHNYSNSLELEGCNHFDNSTDYSFAMPIRSMDLIDIDLDKLTAKELFELNPY